MKNIIIVGAGGFGREVWQYVKDSFGDNPDYAIKGFLDDYPERLAGFSLEDDIIGNTQDYVVQENDCFLIAVGEPAVRQELAERLAAKGAEFLTLIHPRAYVAATAQIGVGCIISPFATVGSFAKLEDHVVLTFYASVGHDAQVGPYSALSPHSVTNGGSVLGQAVFLGTLAVVNPLKQVGCSAKVAAGAVVYRDVPESSLASGNPAKARPLLRSTKKD